VTLFQLFLGYTKNNRVCDHAYHHDRKEDDVGRRTFEEQQGAGHGKKQTDKGLVQDELFFLFT
jgi:hypothetical protein